MAYTTDELAAMRKIAQACLRHLPADTLTLRARMVADGRKLDSPEVYRALAMNDDLVTCGGDNLWRVR